ncbi:MAG TPA: hypothetical protein VH724_09360 [Candidatus Angelobacter sp.]|nr:hypothetical protein [Candidatus Angelobacter sp.]
MARKESIAHSAAAKARGRSFLLAKAFSSKPFFIKTGFSSMIA